MIKVVDIERLKKRYLYCVGTQFDNAIFVAENEFLIDAYTKDEVTAMFRDLLAEVEHRSAPIATDSVIFGMAHERKDVLEIIRKYAAKVDS